MNEVISTILARRSVRAYESKAVSADDLNLILKCGSYAPTGMAVQPWHFSAVCDRGLLDEIKESCRKNMLENAPEPIREMAKAPDFDPFRGAPVCVIVSGDGSGMAAADCANAVTTMALAAQSLGLNTCYLAGFKDGLVGRPDLQDKVGVPQGYTVYYGLSIGYGTETPEAAPRKEGIINIVG